MVARWIAEQKSATAGLKGHHHHGLPPNPPAPPGCNLLTGLLAGGVVDRAIVGGPAWQELGAQAWAQYSRLADLGAGLLAYPIEGIGSTLLSLAATISHYVESSRVRGVTGPLIAPPLTTRGGTDHARPPRAPDATCGPAGF